MPTVEELEKVENVTSTEPVVIREEKDYDMEELAAKGVSPSSAAIMSKEATGGCSRTGANSGGGVVPAWPAMLAYKVL